MPHVWWAGAFHLRINFTFNHGFEIVQVQSAMHLTTCAIGIRCHVSANGSVVPSMVLRYLHDRRVGKGTKQTRQRLCASYVYCCCTSTFYFNLQSPNVRVRDYAPATQRRVLRRPGTVCIW